MNINDENFKNTDSYKKFMEENPSTGSLKVRAYAAKEAVPIQNLRITVKHDIDNNDITFFDGYTNSSGVIEKIILPAPKLDQNNLDVPEKTTYEVIAKYENLEQVFKVNIYENICVVQNISIMPTTKVGDY